MIYFLTLSLSFPVDNFYTNIGIVEKQWIKVLENIKEQVTPANYRTWFSQTSCDPSSNGTLIINVPSAFIKDNLSKRYLPLLQSAVESIYGRNFPIDFK
ncbi:MAG: DnaA N-terminal domain-containing protein, partial [bacterium]|nr:DnaA N-terminal domain-containing protein [bacterium]